MIWLIASLIVLFSIFLVISIPSIFLLFKMGPKKYFKVIYFLYKEYRNIENVYRINKKINYIDQYGNSFTSSEMLYYITIISETKAKVIDFKSYDDCSIYRFTVCEYTKNESSWVPNEYRINHNSCIFTSLLFLRFTKKINKLKDYAIDLESIEKLNNIINSDIKELTREIKINKILSN